MRFDALKAACLFTLTAILPAMTAMAFEEAELSSTWLVQPATKSSIGPDETAWGKGEFSAREARLSPACWQRTKFTSTPMDKINSAWFEQKIKIPESWAGTKISLDFQRIEGDAIVFVNGERVGELLRPGGEIEIGSKVKAGAENTIRVFSTRDYTDISRGFEQDLLRYAVRTNKNHPVTMEKWAFGITAPVTAISRPSQTAIEDITIQTSVRRKSIRLDLDIDSTKDTSGLSIKFEVFDQNGAKAFSVDGQEFSVKAGRESVPFEAEWENPILWELDKAYLYTAKTSLFLNGRKIDEAKPIKFGFREVWTDGRKIFLNGHECRFRLSALWSVSSGGAGNVDLMRLIGYNAGYIQAHSGLWWGSWNESPVYDQDLLNRCDETGYAIFLPTPTAREMTGDFVKNPALRKDLESETKLFINRYKNHPAIFGWMVSMNGHIGDLYRATQSPTGMGHKFTDEETAGSNTIKASNAVCEIVKRADPTRLSFAHAEGGIGDIATSNVYLNFVPLQEREEWPMQWSRTGDLPFMSVETGQPHIGNFWKDSRLLLTEYLAMYFGNDAYLKEPQKLLEDTVKLGATIDHDGQGDNVNDKTMGEHPLYWDFQSLFVRNTNRSWRSWDFNGGWSYWLVTTHYGLPPGEKPNQSVAIVKIYNKIVKGINAKPAWANQNFDIHSQANKPLLVYLAGWPRHTDKTHAFYEGELVEKSMEIVWDGPNETEVDATWTLKDSSGKELASGHLASGVLQAGEIKQIPFSFTAPKGTEVIKE